MSPEVVFECLVSVIDSLCRDEWFTPRVSCTALISKVYFKLTELMKSRDVSEQLKSLRDNFFALCKDDTPMVRRAAARNLSSVFSVMEDEYVPLFVNQYQNFMNEDVCLFFSSSRPDSFLGTYQERSHEFHSHSSLPCEG